MQKHDPGPVPLLPALINPFLPPAHFIFLVIAMSMHACLPSLLHHIHSCPPNTHTSGAVSPPTPHTQNVPSSLRTCICVVVISRPSCGCQPTSKGPPSLSQALTLTPTYTNTKDTGSRVRVPFETKPHTQQLFQRHTRALLGCCIHHHLGQLAVPSSTTSYSHTHTHTQDASPDSLKTRRQPRVAHHRRPSLL